MRRKKYTGKLKAQIALEALKEEKTTGEIASIYGIHPNQVSRWKKEAIEKLPMALEDGRQKKTSDFPRKEEEYLKEIGQLTMSINFLKKKLRPYL